MYSLHCDIVIYIKIIHFMNIVDVNLNPYLIFLNPLIALLSIFKKYTTIIISDQPKVFDFQPKVTRILTIVCEGELFNLDYFTTTLMSEFESFLH